MKVRIFLAAVLVLGCSLPQEREKFPPPVVEGRCLWTRTSLLSPARAVIHAETAELPAGGPVLILPILGEDGERVAGPFTENMEDRLRAVASSLRGEGEETSAAVLEEVAEAIAKLFDQGEGP